MAEETGGHEADSPYCWYVDPLDGTTNFAHSYPVFCVSIGLARQEQMIVGVIYDPTRDELFAAEKGRGANLNGEPIRVSAIKRLEEALVVTGFPSKKRHKNPSIHFYHEMNMRSHGARRPGSAAIDLAYVASGRMDCFWEFHLQPWDLAAGRLLVEEAGGRMTDAEGRPHRLDSPSILASNGHLHEQLLQAFGEISSGKYQAELPPVNRTG